MLKTLFHLLLTLDPFGVSNSIVRGKRVVVAKFIPKLKDIWVLEGDVVDIFLGGIIVRTFLRNVKTNSVKVGVGGESAMIHKPKKGFDLLKAGNRSSVFEVVSLLFVYTASTISEAIIRTTGGEEPIGC